MAQLLLASYTLDSMKARAQILPTYQEYARELAIEDNLNVQDFLDTISCESGWNATIKGDQDKAEGIAQIRLDYWPSITKEKADDPYWALRFMASQWAQHHETYWSCYKNRLTASIPIR
jgi:hypothetical protein